MEWWQIQQLIITVAIICGVLVPVFGLTYRLLEKTSRRKRLSAEEATSPSLPDPRLDHMERQLEDLEGLVHRLVDAAEFDRQLMSGAPSEADQ